MAKNRKKVRPTSLRRAMELCLEHGSLGKLFNSTSRQLEKNIERLRHSEQRQKDILHGTNVGTWEWSIQTGETIINERWAEIVGYTLEELVPMDFDTWLGLVHPDDLKQADELLKRHLSRELDYYDSEVRMRHKNGEWVWVQDRGKVVEWTEDGKPLRMSGIHTDISEGKRAEEILALENKVLSMITNNFPIVEILDSINLGVEEITPGLLSSILLLDDDGIHLRHGSAPSLPSDYNQAIEGIEIGPNVGSCGTAAYLNKQVIVSDIAKDPLWANYRDLAQKHGLGACWSTPIRNASNNVIGTFAIYSPVPKVPNQAILDLIDRMTNMAAISIVGTQAETALRESEKKYRGLLENSPDGMVIVNAKGEIRFVNKQLQRMTAYTAKELIGQLVEVLVPERFEAHQQHRHSYLAEPRTRMMGEGGMELFVRRRDGSEFPVEISLSTLQTVDGLNIFVTIRDISEHKKAEKTIRKSVAMLAEAQRIAHVGSWETDIPVNGRMWSDEMCRIFEVESEKSIASYEAYLDIVHPDDRARFDKVYTDALNENKRRYNIEYRLLMKDGRVKHVHQTRENIFDENGELIRSIGTVTDITERKQAEKEIARFSRIFEETLNEIYLFDVASLKFVQVNHAALHNLGYTLEELQELTPLDIKPEFTPESFADLLAPLRTGEKESVVFEAVHQRKDRSLYDVEVHLQLMKHENEALFAAIITDITERKQQEAALGQAQKMEAVGQLTGGIAHDFNNLLSIISGNLRFLREDLGKTSKEIDELFEDATSAVDDGAELTQRLLGFSRIRLLHPETKDVNDTIEKSVRFLSRTLADHTDLETVLPDETLFINVDPSQLESALLNLCINARDGMAEGGTITIRAGRYHHGSDDTDDYSLSLPEGDYVEISVSDTGSGISPEDMQHVYEPFFTTKKMGKGSGLGLSMVFGFTEQSHGACHIDSTLGEGTTVSMVFPEVVEQKDMDQTPEDAAELSLHGSGVILVVEDEPRVRRVTLRDLKKLGYQTLEAENADIARTIIESGEPIDLLFSDILMPGEMDGHMLAVWAQEHYPEIKIVLTSGYTKGKTEVKKNKEHRFPLLRKPYSSEKLARQIKTVLMRVS